MAPSRSKAAPIGSAPWVQDERDQVSQLVNQDVEEFSYSVRNELEWLNEHMGDIFSKTQVNFADMFKTPSRMRGKTPRTARKRDAQPARQPLTDIFAPSAQPATTAVQAIDFQPKTFTLAIPQDKENQQPDRRPISRGKSPNRAGIPYVDSGYHGMTEDEMDVDSQAFSNMGSTQDYANSQAEPVQAIDIAAEQTKENKADETGTSEESFVSAEEAIAARNNAIPTDTEMQDDDRAVVVDEEVVPSKAGEEQAIMVDTEVNVEPTSMDVDNQSQSDLSSPENPLQRKSSFTFSALPAREPLGAKRSIGNRSSQIEALPTRTSTLSKSLGSKNVESEKSEPKDIAHQSKPAEPEVRSKTSTQLLQERISMLGKTKEPRPSKSNPQISFAAQAVYPQLPEVESESTITVDTIAQSAQEPTKAVVAVEDEDEDWIAPTRTVQPTSRPQTSAQSLSPVRPGLHHKSISASTLPSASKLKTASILGHSKASSTSHPNLADTLQSTTPVGSPLGKKTTEGTISASKNRLWSALKSAKNIFASSASASAAAKLEAHNDSPVLMKSPRRDFSDESRTTAIFNMPGALYSERELAKSPARPISILSLSPKRTRSSTENERKREKEAKEQQKATENLEKVREKERQKAAKQHQDEIPSIDAAPLVETEQGLHQTASSQYERPPSADAENPPTNTKQTSSFKSSILSSGKLRAPGRPVRPTRGATQSKPAPVSIRVASQSQRVGQGQTGPSTLCKSQHEGSGPGLMAKDTSSSRPSSAQSNRAGPSAPVNARVKALEAAARKKEADERMAQKKAEQKRELERKRALKAEEEKRAEEERKAAEAQRQQEAKLAAQRKAEKQAEARRKEQQERAEQQRREQERIEQQRREQERIEQERRREQERIEQERRREQERAEQQRREQERLEQLRQQEEARKAREAHELADKISRERAQQAQQSHPRGDVGGTIRQLIKHTIPQLNPAKPAKRQIQPEDDEPAPPPQRPAVQRGPPSYQQNDAKRRRTNEEQDEPDQRRSVMAPPKRPSNLRKETLSKFPHGYTHASGSAAATTVAAAHHGPSMFKAAVAAQHQFHHGGSKGTATHPSQMVQISNARIPFAENNNPPGAHHAPSSQMYPGYENGQPSTSVNKFKTPARPGQAPKSAKSSPLYQNGDHIALPEIATDSEDEESDDDGTAGFRAPSWVASPALRELLTQQQLVDPESVFGPIAELKMDEVFKGAKNPERLKRFRDRGSSAMWIESGDAVTSAEKRRDMEMRERVAKEGGWRYEPGA